MTAAALRPPAAPPAGEGGPPLILSPWMEVEHLDERAATLYLSSDGTRIKVPLALHRLLLRFRSAARPGDVSGTGDAAARTARAIAQLRDKGFLVPADAIPVVRPRQVTDPPMRIFDAPAQKLSPAQADVVVFGVPWDFGDPHAAGARHGPQAIREVSLQLLYRLDRESGRPLGWFDADRRCPILAGVSVADAGDVIVNHGESRSAVAGRVRTVIDTLTRDGAMPVLLGGDRSAALPLVDQGQRGGALEVIRIGRAPHAPAAQAYVRQVLELPGVTGCTCIVPRHIGRDHEGLPDGCTCTPVDAVLHRSRLQRGMRSDDAPRVHVGIDVEALARAGDEGAFPSLAYRDVHALLLAIGRSRRIVSVDLCGLNPWGPAWNAVSMTALHLLLTVLSAAKDPA